MGQGRQPNLGTPGTLKDELDLIKAVLAGETHLYGDLVEQHKIYITSLIFRHCGDDDIAQELAQETFLRSYKGLRGFRTGSSFRTWLTRIAINVANSYLTSRRYRERCASCSWEQKHHDKLLTTDGSALDPDSLDLLRNALSRLSRKYRDALLLVHVEGSSYADAGEILGVPAGTVSSRVTTGLTKLRSLLSQVEVKK